MSRHVKIFCFTYSTACIALAVARVVLAADPTPPAAKPAVKPAAKSLDDELLRSLDNNLSNGIDDKPAADKPRQNANGNKIADKSALDPKTVTKKPESPLNPLDEQLRESLEGGEDLGSPGEDQKNPLARIVVRMRLVQQRLAESKSDNLTQEEQQRISAELKSLIEQLVQQQQQQQSSGTSTGQKASRDKPKQGDAPPGKAPPGDPDKDPSRGSSPKLRANHSDKPDAEIRREAVTKELDRLHLPDKDREEMLQAPPDQFLPGHESSIEQYFQRLIEQEDERAGG